MNNKQTTNTHTNNSVSRTTTLAIKKSDFIPFSRKSNIKNDYKFKKLLGEGVTGRVFLCEHKEFGYQRAIKVILKEENGYNSQTSEEFQILMDMDHPNIIKLYEVYETATCLYLVMELCEGDELFK